MPSVLVEVEAAVAVMVLMDVCASASVSAVSAGSKEVSDISLIGSFPIWA
jgi:hypothetical protein